jgi:hypothetical protein
MRSGEIKGQHLNGLVLTINRQCLAMRWRFNEILAPLCALEIIPLCGIKPAAQCRDRFSYFMGCKRESDPAGIAI